MNKLTFSRFRTKVRRKIERKLEDLRVEKVEMMPLPVNRGKPRILYILQAYPNFSENYMHEEIRSLSEQFDIKIVTYEKSRRPRLRAWNHDLIEYKAPNLAYRGMDEINLKFDDPEQVAFLRRLDAVIQDFRPDVMHCHYLGLGLLLSNLAETYQVPFTIRTHSIDILSEPDDKLAACRDAVNSPWCLRVLAFPESAKRLLELGVNAEKVVSCWPVVKFDDFYRPEVRPKSGKILCCGPAIRKKAHNDFIDLAVMMRDSGLAFDLYAAGPYLSRTEAHRRETNADVRISYADPEDMPEVYPRYDWLVYPSDVELNKVGLPLGVVEAQASGIGICMQELPGRRQEQLDFLGGGGFLYKTLDEVPEILSRPYPEEMRQAGFEAARRCDIESHKHLLSEVWQAVKSEPASQA